VSAVKKNQCGYYLEQTRLIMAIQNKLFALYFFANVFLVLAPVLIIHWSLGNAMLDEVNARELQTLEPVCESLIAIYQKSNSWREIQDKQQQFRRLIDMKSNASEFPLGVRLSDGEAQSSQRNNERQGRLLANDISASSREGSAVNYALLDADKGYLVGTYPQDQNYNYIELAVAKELVGYLAVSQREYLSTGYELDFVKQQQKFLLLIALGFLLLTMLISVPLIKYFLKPIRQLTAAMGQLARDNYEQDLGLKLNDGSLQLERDFNQLATTLQGNEDAYKRWLRDISHSLHKPVTLLEGEIDAMLDAVRPINLSQLGSANEELKKLEQLLKDLYEFTCADIGGASYCKRVLELEDFLLGEVDKYQPMLEEKSIFLNLILQKALVIIYADPERLHQLCSKLFMNIINYAENVNHIQLSVLVDKDTVRVIFEDDGPEVEKQVLEQLFDRPYRVESIGKRGEGGLGLAICKQIVRAHQGQIHAFKSSMGGLAIQLKLPLHK
jgi:two-component system sensor histidine kinase BaeS